MLLNRERGRILMKKSKYVVIQRLASILLPSILLAFVLLLIPQVGYADAKQIEVTVNGKAISFDVQPINIDGRILVPVRAIFYEMGADIKYENETRTVFAVKDGTMVVLSIGDRYPTINGQVFPIDQPGIIIGGRTLVPLRFAAEAFGGTVVWDGQTQTAAIMTKSDLTDLDLQVKDDSLDLVKEKGKLTIGCVNDFPPIAYQEKNGVFSGFDADLAGAVTNRIGVDLEVKYIDWTEYGFMLNAREIDAIWSGMTITDERRERMLFTAPYLTFSQTYIVLSDNTVEGKQDLPGKTIGYLPRCFPVELYDELIYPGLRDGQPGPGSILRSSTWRAYKDAGSVLDAMQKGEIDAILADQATLGAVDQTNPLYRGISMENMDYEEIEEWGVGFRLRDTALRNAVQEALDEIISDGTYTAIADKWLRQTP